jgi:glycosyltransferase involved in cell wall biosynthesis
MGVFSTRAVGKSFDAVLDAFDEIARVHDDAELILIGDLGPSSTPAGRALAERIAASAMGSRVRLTGKLSLAKVARTISSLDLYLFPMDTGANTRSGTLPVALGSAVPVVAIRGIETDPMFVHGENVYFADALDGPSFARAALRIFADPVLGGGIAQGGRRLYERYLSWERIADDLLAALD